MSLYPTIYPTQSIPHPAFHITAVKWIWHWGVNKDYPWSYLYAITFRDSWDQKELVVSQAELREISCGRVSVNEMASKQPSKICTVCCRMFGLSLTDFHVIDWQITWQSSIWAYIYICICIWCHAILALYKLLCCMCFCLLIVFGDHCSYMSLWSNTR